MKPLIWIPLILFAAVLQVALFSEISLMGNYFELLFAIVVFLGVRFGWYEGCLWGMVCGLLNDGFSTSPFGYSVLVYGLSGFLAAFFETVIFTQHIGTRLLILFIMSLFSTAGFLALIHGPEVFVRLWGIHKLNLVSISAVNTLFAVPLYMILERITHGIPER